jgi:hypothetical protein
MPSDFRLFGQPIGSLPSLVGDLRQLASVRRFELREGVEDGVRGLAFDTGGGLAFWVLDGRCLDIATLSWRGMPCAWQGAMGFRNPALHNAESEGGTGFHRSFSGLLVTCGLDRVRQPAPGGPLHGRLPFTPARLTAWGEDWERSEPILFCEGEVIQAASQGESWRLRRRIDAPIGGGTIRLTDIVDNRTATARPQHILYHFNFGFPLLRQGSEVFLDGMSIREPHGGVEPDGSPSVRCHRAAGAEWSTAELRSPAGPVGPAVTLRLTFATDNLPWLQTWRQPRPGMHVLSLEPCNSERGPDGQSIPDPSCELAPWSSRTFRLELSLGDGFA